MDRIAVAVGETRVSHPALAARVGGIRRAVPAGAPAVAGYFDHGVDGVASFLAVLDSGPAYVPLAPVLGRDRVVAAIADSGAATVLTTHAHRDHLAGLGAEVIVTDDLADADASPPTPGPIAYIIYTSGSTGRPKGVAVSRRALTASTRARRALYGDGGTLFLAAPFCFDSVLSMFGPLTSGGTVRLASPSASRDPVRLAAEAALDATHLLLLPSVYRELLEVWGEHQPPELAVAIVAGEAATPDLVRRHFAVAPARRLVNEYGPTEATVFCTAHDCSPGDVGPVPIGRPVTGYRIAVLGADLTPVAAGEVGEICVGGTGLAEGYVGDPGLTARRFVPAEHGRWYRTGDLGRWRDDGVLEYHGRTDLQVKIRGVRVELGEVDRLLEGIDEVTEAAAVLVGGQLIGYLRGDVDTDAIRRRLRVSAPAHLVPHLLVALPELPRTSTGKIDRRALAARGLPGAGGAPVPTAVTTSEPHAILAAAVGDVLGRVPAVDEPFVHSGDSLAAMRVVARLHTAGWSLDPAVLLGGGALSAAAPALNRRGETTNGQLPPGPLSPNQLGIWYAASLARDATAFTVPLRMRVAGRLDADRLRKALDALIVRHPVLSCRIGERGGRPAMEPTGEPPWLDVVSTTQPGRVAAAEAAEPIDVRCDPPFRAVLAELPDGRSELLLTLHHIAFDGWSKHVLVRDLADAYSGRTRPAPPDFRRFASALAAADARGEFTADAAAAAALLRGLPTLVSLRTDRGEAAYQAAGQVVDVAAPVRAGLERLARDLRTTPFAVLLGGFAAGLTELTGQHAVVLGSVVANRPTPGLEESIGLFTNVVPIGLELPPGSDPVIVARDRLLSTLKYAHVPFHRVVEAVAPDRQTSHPPLVQVLFEHLGATTAPVRFDDIEAELDDGGLQQGAVVDFSIRVFPRRAGYRCVAVHDASVVEPDLPAAILRSTLATWRRLAARTDVGEL
ncbi:amino acid adenylation domain-containing protein [Actinophytocola sp.]|uniref:amino acid adenylation domain-containing protein n=1 Tax=Actinophytocola sp. TaxID=1872138 RepID=UPI003D6A1BC3